MGKVRLFPLGNRRGLVRPALHQLGNVIEAGAEHDAVTSTNRISEASTLPPGTGETASAVRKMPYTVQGWRPTSVTNQPQSTARKPSGDTQTMMRRNQRVV